METNKIPYTFLVVILSLGHFLFLMYFFAPAYNTPDANGYFTQARLIAEDGKTGFKPESVLQYVAPHWHSTPRSQFYYSTFPPGFPFLLAVAIKIFGFKAAFYVNPFLASLSLLIFFFICRFWLANRWSLMATGIMALNPFANEHALFGDSHTSVIFFLLSGLLLWQNSVRCDQAYVRAGDDAESDDNAFFCRFSWSLALLAGISIGLIPTIRYAEFLFIPAFVLYALLLRKDKRIRPRTSFALAIGILIPLMMLGARNQTDFGSFFRTGYSLHGEPPHFSVTYFGQNFLPFFLMLVMMGAGLMFILGIIGIYSLRKTEYKNEAILFASLITPTTLLYMAYYWPADRQSMRFLLPTFFIYTLAGVWALSRLANERKGLIYAALIISILWGVVFSILPLAAAKERNQALAMIYDKIEKSVPKRSVLITNQGIGQFLDYYGSWKLVNIALLNTRSSELEGLKKTKKYAHKTDSQRRSYEKIRALKGQGATSSFQP